MAHGKPGFGLRCFGYSVYDFVDHSGPRDVDVFECLRQHNVATCHADDEDLDLPFVPTADWGYLRLRRPQYSDAELESWIRRALDAGFKRSHVFFKHEDEGAGPSLAVRFQELSRASSEARIA